MPATNGGHDAEGRPRNPPCRLFHWYRCSGVSAALSADQPFCIGNGPWSARPARARPTQPPTWLALGPPPGGPGGRADHPQQRPQRDPRGSRPPWRHLPELASWLGHSDACREDLTPVAVEPGSPDRGGRGVHGSYGRSGRIVSRADWHGAKVAVTGTRCSFRLPKAAAA
jgi:hypothetical protein